MIKVFNFDHSIDEFCANIYIVGKENGPCVIIDYGSTSQKLINYIKIHYSEVRALLLTHGHFDHIRGLSKFHDYFSKTPIYIDEFDYELLKNPKFNGSYLTNETVKINLDVKVFKNLDILNFGDGLKFQVFETPYHTDGSVCLLNQEENALFTGDSLFKGSIGRDDLITSNRNLLKDSLEIIKGFDTKLVVYPGHGFITTIGEELKNNPYLN